MSNVTKPIALNETFKTTENTPRNLADVLAQALQALNTTISGLNFINAIVVEELPTVGISTTTIYLVPNDDPQSENIYDEYINLDGTSAGWEKIGSTEIDLSNYYTKTETDTLLTGKVDKVNGKGLSTNDYTDAEKAKLADIEANAEVNVQSDWNEADNTKDDYIKNKPSSEVKTATDTFTTVNGGLLEECIINLVPVQDLHGYDSPWVGGAGKNKCDNSTNISGYYDASGNYSAGDNKTSALIEVSANTDYTASLFDTSDNSRVAGLVYTEWDASQNFIQQVANVPTITTGATTKYLRVRNYNAQNDLVNSNHYAYQLEQGSSATSYAPYTNICPISGHTEVDLQRDGKNLLNPSKQTEDVSTRKRWYWTDGFLLRAGITYSFTEFHDGDEIVTVYFMPMDSVDPLAYASHSVSYTPTEDTYIRLQALRSGGVPVGTVFQLELGSTVTPYEPYQGHLYQVQIGSNVYGGYVDLVSGVMTATYKGVDMGSLTWVYSSGVNSMVTTISDAKQPSADDVELDAILPICRVIKASRRGQETGIRAYMFADNTYNLYIRDSGYVDATIFTTFVTGMAMTYELATPLIIQLTPQQLEALVGQNNLSTPLDGQSIDSVEYREVFAFDDVEKVVSLRVPISMLGTDESGRTTASQAYASGDYFYKDGYMCKALTSISAGATLTLNTNYSQGTLADILKAIENS